MEDLTFGEQVKIVLGRRGMTIKQLAELIEVKTGKKMSRQNLTQRLGRDNFQEQDMRMIAEILECPFRLSILSGEVQHPTKETVPAEPAEENVQMQQEPEDEDRIAAAEASESVYQTAVTEEETESAEQAAEAEETAAVTAVEEAAEQIAAVTEESAAAQSVSVEETDAVVQAEAPAAAEAEYSADSESKEAGAAAADLGPDERDMTIGELYDIHQELTELEENAKAGESVEEIKKELEKPKRDWFRTGGLFLRGRRQREEQKREEEQRKAEEQRLAEERQKAEEQRRLEAEREAEALRAAEEEMEAQAQVEAEPGTDAQAQYEAEAEMASDAQYETEADLEAQAQYEAEAQAEAAYMQGEDQDEVREEYMETESAQSAYSGSEKDDFEPVIAHNDAEEDTAVGDVNPYTGREYQSNSVRMHPSRIGYVQVYDRTIHKWTDMTEWAFLGLQERKKALLGKAYEPPIYLD